MFCTFENNILTIKNELLTRTVRFENGVPMQSTLQSSGTVWATDGTKPIISLAGVDLSGAVVTPLENGVLLETEGLSLRWEFSMPANLPFVESTLWAKGTLPETGGSSIGSLATGVETTPQRRGFSASYTESFGSASHSLDVRALDLRDVTDHTNTLLRVTDGSMYFRGHDTYNGQIFLFSDHSSGEECIAAKLSPSRLAHYNADSADLMSETCANIHLCAPGLDAAAVSPDEWTPAYTCVLGLCPTPERERLLRAWYRSALPGGTRYIMSNTWGDRNQDKCICEEFILREIDRAAEIGVDILQIDDGWQQGITANSALKKSTVWNGGYRAADEDFWAVNKEKFPRGLQPVVDYAKEKSIGIGLWFSPDGADNYAGYKLDVETLYGFYKEYGIRHFKLDGIATPNRTAEKNLFSMLQELTDLSHGEIVFNMDITAGCRPGYLPHREKGDLFVENRYTDWGNYYPHATLRSLWQLSKYLPTERMQFEVLNLRRNKEKYNDILGPNNYDMDYAFACVMAAKPLVWMEMTGLNEEDTARLQKIAGVFKAYRNDFLDVEPIGTCPTGYSLTGFRITGKKNDYLLLLRENTESGTLPVELKEILATNDENAGRSPATLTKPRSYLFGIIKK